MTDSSMNFGPAWIRNLRSEGTTTVPSGGTTGGTRYQLAEYRYGREEMLALFDKSVKPPPSLQTFKTLYSEQTLTPLALLPNTEEEQRGWQTRPTSIGGAPRGRGGSLERGGRISRGRGGYQPYGRATSAYDSGWGNGEQPDWSPRKDYSSRSALMDNWRRTRNSNDDDEGWRNISSSRPLHEKWVRSSSWRGDGDSEDRNNGPHERVGRPNWHENSRGGPLRRSWDNEDHLPEWANENPTEGGGTFDERGAFHGSDDEQESKRDRKDMLQKSISQQHIPNKGSQLGLSSSKSTTALSKSDISDKMKEDPSNQESREENGKPEESSSPEIDKPNLNAPHKMEKTTEMKRDDKPFEEMKTQSIEKSSSNGPPHELPPSNIDKVDEDFDRLQEDLVLKLVVDEETPKTTQTSTNFDVQAPPNLVPPSQEKWYYQDPQGTRQGPFANVEMAEWYKAGYFSNQLNVMRECDERYFLLGELINLCGGENPFLSNVRFPVLKNEPAKLPDEMLSYQFLSQLAFKQQMSLRNLSEPWNALTLQQQEMAAQRLLLQQQQQQQIPPDLQFMPQSTPSNPLMYMINQMQQGNKLPSSVLVDKPSSSVPNQLDPLLVQMGNMQSLQNRIQTPGLHNLPGGVPTNLSSSLPSDGLGSGLPNLQTPPIAPGLSSLPGLHGTLPSGLPGSVNVNRPTSHTSMDQMQSGQDNDPLTNFLKQFQQQQRPLDNLWQKQNQFNVPPPVSTPTQWPQQSETPISMWDIQPPTSLPSEVSTVPTDKTQQADKDKEQRPKEEITHKELKKRKEHEDKQAKKEAEERRKQEQRKQEAEKKAAEEKKKKEEEKVRKELERAKKEAEEKRLRELEEKRRLKEQRKAEEEARKKEELKRLEEEKNRREMRDREERKQAEASRLSQNQSRAISAKTAPWSQSNFTPGVTLSEIQKAEKEKRAQETALQIQKQHLHEQQQQQIEKATTGLHLNWAKKPMEPTKVKSFAEIQAEEQEKLAKLSAEAKLAAQLKEKDTPIPNSGNIWNGQSLTWANASSTSQWSTNSAGGFWDEVPTKSSNKPSTVSKSNSTSAMTTTTNMTKQQQQQKQSKTKNKKEESPKSVNNNNNQTKDEFTEWCYKTLSNISANVDIPTFVTFLRDIESAYDVRDYCKEYLGESPATQQFASNFLEKRRSCKPKNNAHKDDMCSPAPAITPSMQHSTEFQEVKGKNKKNKKSKMLKVDSRILGFNVTSAPDRINVGDRDYGDNS